MGTIATVAGAAISAGGQYASSTGAAKKGKAGKPAFAPNPGQREIAFNRGTENVLNEERSVIEDALAQGAFIQPEMYRALGLEPIYDREEDPDLAGLSERATALRDRTVAVETRLSELRELRPRDALKGIPKGPERKAARKEARAQIKAKKQEGKALTRERQALLREQYTAEEELGRKSTVPRRIIGFKKLDGKIDPTSSDEGKYADALNQYNSHLEAALSGKEPIDPTLKNSYDEKERVLRETLSRQLGTDYATSTAGMHAMANFDRERAEAFAQYNTEQVKTYSSLSDARAASLSNLTDAKLKQLMAPSTFRIGQGEALGSLARDRLALGDLRLRERQKSIGVSSGVSAASSGSNALGALLNSGAQGVASGLLSYGAKLDRDEAAASTRASALSTNPTYTGPMARPTEGDYKF